MRRRRLSIEELEARGLPGPATALALLVGLVAVAGLAFYGVSYLLFKLASWLATVY